MNDKFDELAKGLAQSVSRRGALKQFGVGLAGIALAALGLVNQAHAATNGFRGHCKCEKPDYGCKGNPACVSYCSSCCPYGGRCF
ncbi:MAG TPA: twin-arginine translocation signal domain-containing protein [Verrucomicrobiae bacterium]